MRSRDWEEKQTMKFKGILIVVKTNSSSWEQELNYAGGEKVKLKIVMRKKN